MQSAVRFLGRVILVAIAAVSLFLLTGLVAQPVSAATNFFVGKQGDDAGTAADCGNNANTDCSLRSAIAAANGTAGASQITLPAGAYTLSNGELDLGALANQSITLQGATAATTTIQQDGLHSLFVTDPNLNSGQSYAFRDLTIKGGLDAGFGGGGIQAGAPGQNLSIINCIITGNKSTNAGGGGVAYFGDGTVTITSSTFSGNTAASPATGGSSTGGGLLLTNQFSLTPAAVTITSSTFDANTAGSATSGAQSQGGAIAIVGGAMNVNISKSTFTNNTALNGTGLSGQGGALYNNGGGLTMQFSRLVGNTATTGSALFQGTATGTTSTAIENWWGTNTPAPLISGTTNFTPFLQLTQTAALTSLATGQSTTLTASFLTNSTGGAESASNLTVLIGLPVTWGNPIKGTLSNQQTTIQASGTATATFTATTAGQGSADATVDSGTTTTNPTITIHTTATQLVLTVPARVTAGVPFTVQVSATDASNNVDTTYAGQITLAPSVTDAGATGLGPVTPISGVATFSVTLTKATASQTLGATGSVNGLTGTSTPFSVVAAAPGSITAVAGTPQSATVGTGFATNLQALVKDGFNNPVPNATVTFTAPALTGASGTFASGGISIAANTNGAGIATATAFTADTITGSYTVTAGVGSVATTADVSLTNTPAAPAAIAANGGATPQNAQVGQTFAAALAVTVRDQYGNPVGAGVTVAYAVTPVGGASATLSGGGTAITNASGQASLTATANSTAGGPYAVNASVTGVASPATFSLTNTPGPAASIAATAGTPQSATVGTAFGTALQATVMDASGNAVPGVTVTFTAPGGIVPTGTFTGGVATTTATTNASGVATAPTFTANTKAGGPYSVTAIVAGAGTPASFALTNTPDVAATLTPNAGTTPQSATVNTTFTVPLAATLADRFGNPIGGTSVTFTAPPSGASGTFTGNGNSATATTNTQGVATAPSLTANGTAGGYAVAASGGGVNNATAFALTNLPGAPSSIAVAAGGGQHTIVGTAFATNLQATVRDTNGNLVPNTTVTFAAPTGAGLPTGAFPGGTSVTATTNAQGVATAPTLTANTVAGSFTATASAAGVGTPATFALTNAPGSPAAVTATAGGGQRAPVGTTFPVTLAVAVVDQFGNAAPNVPVTFAAPASGASGAFAAPGSGPSATVSTNAQGVATAPVFTANGTAGGYTVSASVGGVTTPATFALTNTPALVSVAVTAPGTLGNPPTLKIGQTVQLTATGTFTDNSTQDLTNQATWSSDKPDVVSVDASGKLTAKTGGTATITASNGGKQGIVTVTVTAPIFTGVQPAPAPAARPGGASAPAGTPNPAPAPLPPSR